jgi:hypothetical protein
MACRSLVLCPYSFGASASVNFGWHNADGNSKIRKPITYARTVDLETYAPDLPHKR